MKLLIALLLLASCSTKVDYKQLQSKLLAVYEDDQKIRLQHESAQKAYGLESKQIDSLTRVMLHNDGANLITVTDILDKHGWLGADKIGEKANDALFLVIQHSDLRVQQKYLPKMRDAVKRGSAKNNQLALLEDRVAIGEGKQQIYGSQIGFDMKTNKTYVLPLIDPDNVDRRRAKVGLGLMSDYVKHWDMIWDVEEYKKQLPNLEGI
jgi:hypothetical protein